MNNRQGVVFGMSDEEYRQGDEVSNSKLSNLNKSPAHLWALDLDPNRPKQEPTDAMIEGQILHTLVLEPHLFESRFCVKPDGMSFATKEGKAWRAEQKPELAIIKQDQMSAAREQQISLVRHMYLGPMFEGYNDHSEVSVFWTDKATGLPCKARPDRIVETKDGGLIVLDVKRMADPLPGAFQRAIANMGYHRQAAHYTNGLRACGYGVEAFIFATVSASYPYVSIPYVLDEKSEQQGQDEVAELLSLYKLCQDRGEWPAHPPGPQLISLPAWSFPRNEDIVEGYEFVGEGA